MKKILVTSLLFVTTTAYAELAPVTRVEPIIRNEPVMVEHNSCNHHPIHAHQQSSGGAIGAINDTIFGSTGGLVGAVVGGVVGNQIGGGTGRQVARVAGVVIGAKMGDEYSRSYNQPPAIFQARCATSYTNELQQVVVGYNVTYIFDGKVQTTVLPYNPGSYVNVQRTNVVR